MKNCQKLIIPVFLIYLITIVVLMMICIFYLINIEIDLGEIVSIFTAIFTAIAAFGAWKSAMVSQSQISLQEKLTHREHFFTLLDSLEVAHEVVFIRRNKLYLNLEDHISLRNSYLRKISDYQKKINACIEGDIKLEASSTYKGKSSLVYEMLIDYVREVSHEFCFDFKTKNYDYVVTFTGAKVPIDSNEPDNFVFKLDTIVQELLGYKDLNILDYDYSLGRKHEGYFAPFKNKYTSTESKLYKYIHREK